MRFGKLSVRRRMRLLRIIGPGVANLVFENFSLARQATSSSSSLFYSNSRRTFLAHEFCIAFRASERVGNKGVRRNKANLIGKTESNTRRLATLFKLAQVVGVDALNTPANQIQIQMQTEPTHADEPTHAGLMPIQF